MNLLNSAAIAAAVADRGAALDERGYSPLQEFHG
jgi:hypothetical protein